MFSHSVSFLPQSYSWKKFQIYELFISPLAAIYYEYPAQHNQRIRLVTTTGNILNTEQTMGDPEMLD